MKPLIKAKQISKSIFRKLGLEINRYNPPTQKQEEEQKRYSKNLLYEADSTFQKFHSEGMDITKTPDVRAVYSLSKREERFYNLVEFLMQTIHLDGKLVECGCWKGLSSYLICNYIHEYDSGFQGQGFFVIDSFEGLSKPSKMDKITDLGVTGKEQESGASFGTFAASMQEVKNALSEFPKITYIKGWIPSVFKNMPEEKYKFVHIDVDLYEPVHGSVEYFYPRLVDGGVIVFDDYGSLLWPGAKKAVDAYCTTNNISLLRLSTGQAIIYKK